MDFQLEKPQAVLKAQETHKGLNWFVEILVFIAVYFVCMIGQIIALIPGQMIMLFRNEDYRTAVAAGDMEQIMETTLQIGNSDSYLLLSLFSTIVNIIIVVLFCRFLQKRRLETLGFIKKDAGKEYLTGLIRGFAMFSIAALISVLTGAVKIHGFSETFHIGVFLLFLVCFMVQGMSEEVMCRGYFMVSIGRRYSMWIAVFSNAVLFAALHLLNAGISVLAFINLILFGVFASLYFIKTENIWGVSALHSIWNLAQGNFYGLYVSGIQVRCSVLESTTVEAKSMINGGAFGPEGGLAVTAVFLAGIFFLLRKKTEKISFTH